MRALADGWSPSSSKLFALGTGLSLATITGAAADLGRRADVRRVRPAAGHRPRPVRDHPGRGLPQPVTTRCCAGPSGRGRTPRASTGRSPPGPSCSPTSSGGENMHDIVFWLQVFAVVPFIIACAGVVMLAHGDPQRQARAALLSIANPVLIWAVVAGAHNEALSVMFAVAGLMLMRKSPFAAGHRDRARRLRQAEHRASGAWPCSGPTDANRRRPCCSASGPRSRWGWPTSSGQPTAFFQVLRNGGYVSVGSWANPIFRLPRRVPHRDDGEDHRRGRLPTSGCS